MEENRVKPESDSQEGGFTPALLSTAKSGGKPAFPTANNKFENTTLRGTFAPIDILDYIYAVLHRPTYRASSSTTPNTDHRPGFTILMMTNLWRSDSRKYENRGH